MTDDGVLDDSTTRQAAVRSDADAAWELMVDAERLVVEGRTNADRDAAVDRFEAALAIAGDDPNIAVAANLAVAQILGPDASNIDTELLERTAVHARAAREAAIQLGCPEPGYSAACAALGTVLLRVADRRREHERNAGVGEAVGALRAAVAATTPTDPKLLTRQANLAVALLKPVPEDADARLSRLREAVRVLDDVLGGDLSSSQRAVVLSHAAHASQQRAAAARTAGEHGEAHNSFERARHLYRSAIDVGGANDVSVAGTVMGLARLLFEAAEQDLDDELLNEAIRQGSVAVDELVDDLGFEREAAMQLAEMYTERLRRHHHVVDAAQADELSRRALHSWYHERNSIELTKAKTRRCDVLCVIALSDVATDAHIIELDQLLGELYPASERTPQMGAISDMASAARLLSSTDPATAAATHSDVVEVADHFEKVLADNAFAADDPAWWPRWFSLQRRMSAWAEWIGLDASAWMPPLVDAARRFEARLDKVHGSADVVAYGRVQLAGAVKAIAIHERDPAQLRRALDMYESTAMMSSRPGRVATAVGLDAAHLAELLGDNAGARRWIQRARTALERIEWSTTPLEARLSVGRQRYELAGSAAALANDPVELAWILHSTVHPLSPIDRTAFRDAACELSHNGTVVYIAQSRRRCRAAVVIDGQWSLLDLPALALDYVGQAITEAHRAHARRSTGLVGTPAEWETARTNLTAALDAGLSPLAAILAGDSRPVALRLSGWLHAAPTAPALMALTDHSRPIAVSLGLPDPDPGWPRRPAGLVALAAPGGQRESRYLAHVVDDVDHVAALMGGEAIHDATVTHTTAALRSARQVLVACHGESADEAVLARLALHDGDLTAAQILGLDLTGLELAVVAACEALATDRVAPEHPFNVQTAMLQAGAAATCGPLWMIDDDDASLFCRVAFDELAGGATVGDAHRAGVAEVVAAKPDVRDIALVVRNDAILLKPRHRPSDLGMA